MTANTATEWAAAAPEGTAQPRRGLWQGRAAVLVGLVLLGIGLRHAVTLLSPLLGEVREALGLGTAGATFLGMLPTLCFGAAGFLAPVLARKLGAEVVALLAAAGPVGYVGIIFGVGPPWLPALVAGLAGGAFPLAIAMFNLRTRTPIGSATLAGFAMGIGYLAGTLGPLVGGWLYGATGGWTTPLWVYAATLVPMAVGGLMMARPGRYLEDKSGA